MPSSLPRLPVVMKSKGFQLPLGLTLFLSNPRRFAAKRSRLYRLYILLYKLLLVSLFLFLCLAHLRLSYLAYKKKIFSIPPRSSAVDRSLNFTPRVTLHNRHTKPWPKYPDLQPQSLPPDLSPAASRNRYFVSSAGLDVGDGLGHRYLATNYDLILAKALNLTYVHRGAKYGSLTAFDRHAVDKFFGWPHPTHWTRKKFLNAVCGRRVLKRVTDGCYEHLVYCRRPKKNNDRVKRIVTIPRRVAFCLKDHGYEKCKPILTSFTAKHKHPKTIFHTPQVCSWKLFWSNQTATHGFFFNRYWSAARKSRHDPRYVNIAVHVRRGDFLKLSSRVSIPDAAYARVVKRIIATISDEEQEDSAPALRFRVEVYSQGLFRPQTRHPLLAFLAGKGLFGFHNVNDYGSKYVSEKGVETDDGYWEALVGTSSRVSIDLHVSEDTLEGLEQMISADILVGSMSALSVHVAATLSRGIPFLPLQPPAGAGSNKTIVWDPNGFARRSEQDLGASYFDANRFREVWRSYRTHIGADRTPFGTMR